ncbi:hypothetical protein SOPP22_11270 [Shewanella sp. OPT22]|nr:hypothetical protein SOPP22_11270 [Shewanella sp. OPT22]
MSKFASFIIGLAFVSAVVQINFLFNSETINGEYLTLIGISVGLIFAFLLHFYRRRQFIKSMHIIFDHNNSPWHQKPPNHLLEAFFAIFLGSISVTLLNNVPDTGKTHRELYTVQYESDQLIKYNSVSYVLLTNGLNKIKYKIKDGDKFKNDEKVEVTFKIGLLGFSTLVDCKPSNN